MSDDQPSSNSSYRSASTAALPAFFAWFGRWWSVGGALVGLAMLGLGLWLLPGVTRAELRESDQGAAAHAETQQLTVCRPAEPDELTVDVSGAVVSPGVYQLPVGSLLADAVAQAGGFSPSADTRRVAQTINLARPLTAAEKIYIPEEGEQGAAGAEESGQSTAGSDGAGGGISINSASAAQLETLTGIGEKRAAEIIAGRPYERLEQLVTEDVISQGVFDKIRAELRL